jgi:hypothetical protein
MSTPSAVRDRSTARLAVLARQIRDGVPTRTPIRARWRSAVATEKRGARSGSSVAPRRWLAQRSTPARSAGVAGR